MKNGAACKGFFYSCGYLFPLFAYMERTKKNITNITTGKELGNRKKKWLEFFRENGSKQAMGYKTNLYFAGTQT